MSQNSLYDVPNTYGGLKEEFNSLEKSKVVILPIPLEKTSSYARGTEYGPSAILDSSKNMELYDKELGCDPSTIGIYTDMSLMNSNFALINISESIRLIETTVRKHLKKNKFVVCIGGEHSITIGIVKAFSKIFKSDFTVVQFDAHADLRDEYESQKLSHACVMRRVIENNKVVQIGVRSLSIEEAQFIKEKKLKIHWACAKAHSKLVNSILKDIKTKNIYITFDFDFLDPSIMPAVGTPEPGGYNWDETISILKELIRRKTLIGIDFNELTPLKNGILHPNFLASKLIYKALAYRFFWNVKR